MQKQAEEWIQYAKTDLLTVKEIINNELLTSVVAFHSQQCIEKSFKGILELYDRKVPRIHDLRKLWNKINELPLQFLSEINFKDLDEINQVYIDARYPSDYGLLPDGKPSLEKVKDFMNLAETIYKEAEKIIS